MTFINLEVWNRIPPADRPELQQPEHSFRGVNGEPLKVLGKAVLQIAVGDHIIQHLTWIGEVVDQAIIGIDLLSKYQCQMDCGQKKLIWGFNQATSLRTTSDLLLQPKTVNMN